MTVRKAYSTSLTPVGPRSIKAICSTGETDRTGEVVVQSGADLNLYRQNPIVLFSHLPEHPIGLASNVGLVNGNLCANITFADLGVSPKADEVCALVKAGILKSISIGFDPISVEPMDKAKPRGPLRYLKWALCELSICAVPCNPNAIITDKSYAVDRFRISNDPTRDELRAKAGAFANKYPSTFETETPDMPDFSTMTRAERIAHAQAVVARGQRNASQAGERLPLTGRAAEVQRNIDHVSAVMALQRKANPTREDKLAAIYRASAKDRPAGY